MARRGSVMARRGSAMARKETVLSPEDSTPYLRRALLTTSE
jgi:hypothetical protein